MSAVLVCGGAGYVGSHTCKALAKAGFVPVTYDDLSAGHRELVKWGPLVEGALADGAKVRAVLRTHGCTAVVHFAGAVNVGESVTDPRKFVQNNVVGTASLLDAMLAEDVKRIVFSSSCATYGIPQVVPIPEDHPKAPVNHYGETKRFVEEMLAAYERAYGLGRVALRYFNAAGADGDGEAGELHEPETHLLPLAIEAALGRGKPLTVFGCDYPTPDGTAVRDYVHVTDLADAHVRALRRLVDGGTSLAANLGTGTGSSVLAVLRAVEAEVGAPVPHTFGPRRDGDPPALVADAALAKRELGWEPVAGLQEIVRSAVRWHRART